MKSFFKVLTAVAVLSIGFAAKAEICDNSKFSANFHRENGKSVVTLTNKETGEHYLAVCEQQEGAIELAHACNIMASTDHGYEVFHGSIGGSQKVASVKSWSMANPTPEPVALTCADSQ
jgi:hypothetical protein